MKYLLLLFLLLGCSQNWSVRVHTRDVEDGFECRSEYGVVAALYNTKEECNQKCAEMRKQ